MRRQGLILTLLMFTSFLKAQSNKPAVFHVLRIPDPIAYVGQHTGRSNISKTELATIEGISLKPPVINKETRFKFAIVSYEFTMNVNGKIIMFNSTGPEFSKELRGYLKNVSAGTNVFIDALKVKYPDGTIKGVPGITLTVK